MSRNRGILKITITTKMSVDGNWSRMYPGCRTIADVAKRQMEYWEYGLCSTEDLLQDQSFCDELSVRIEPA